MPPPRPFYLNLIRIHLPIGGWVSIMHRASGALLSLAAPALLYALMLSLRSAEDFDRLAGFFDSGFGLLLMLAVVWATLHHFFAGLRHLGFDLGWGEEKARSRQTALATLVLTLGLTGFVGLWVS